MDILKFLLLAFISGCGLTGSVTYAQPNFKSDFAEKICGIASSDTLAVVPDEVKELPDYAFADHTSLRKIILPEGMTAIGEYAFLGDHSPILINLHR